MFFGLTNSPATFQTMMNEIFADLIQAGRVLVYMDDILIFSEDTESHIRTVNEVLAIMEKYQLFLKPEKCEFHKTEVEYLGLIVGNGCVRMDPIKVAGIRDWERPQAVKDVQSFLGFTNFYRKFIRDYSRLARPMVDLTRKTVSWSWGKAQEDSFKALKEAICSNPVLHSLVDNAPY